MRLNIQEHIQRLINQISYNEIMINKIYHDKQLKFITNKHERKNWVKLRSSTKRLEDRLDYLQSKYNSYDTV